jgi:hypothetical protein
LENPLPDHPRLFWSHTFMLNLINTFTGAQLFVLTQDAKALATAARDVSDKPAAEIGDMQPEFSIGLLPNHLEHDVYWDDGSH